MSSVAQRIQEEITWAEQNVKDLKDICIPTDRALGYVKGLHRALALIAESSPQTSPGPRVGWFDRDRG